MNPFIKKLNEGAVLVADGATGTNLQKMGLMPGTIPEDLVLDNPQLLLKLAESFVKAGSDIILTCTFGGTPTRMKESRYADRVAEINTRAAEIAHQAAALGDEVMVGGSLGPTGLLLQPYGPLPPEEALSAYRLQAEALSSGGVDLFVIETMFSLDEAAIAFDAVRSVCDLPIVVSFSYDRGTRTMMGVKPAQVMETFSEKGAVAIGANCGDSLENMEKIVIEYSTSRPGFPIWAKPNAGLPHKNADGQTIYDVTPEQMGEAARINISNGARIVGGCCGSSPEHIAGIVNVVKSTRP